MHVLPLQISNRRRHKPFEIKKWNPVAFWQWDIIVDTCAICRNHIMELCLVQSPPFTSTAVSRWLKDSCKRCPLGCFTIHLLTITVCGNTKSMGTRALQEATSGAAAVGSISH
ncbi:hypothetical protein CUMW_036660 [Citrus unshiu]|nr:hypothetical protein CUMW_036660 [Citrus unshiu]